MAPQPNPLAVHINAKRVSLPFPVGDQDIAEVGTDSGTMSLDRPAKSHTKKSSLGAISVSSSIKGRLQKAVASFNPAQVSSSTSPDLSNASGPSSGSISTPATMLVQASTVKKSLASKETEYHPTYENGAVAEEYDEGFSASSDTVSSVYSQDDLENESHEKLYTQAFPHSSKIMTVPSSFDFQIDGDINLTKLTVPPRLKRANPPFSADHNFQQPDLQRNISGTRMGMPVNGDLPQHENVAQMRSAPVGQHGEDYALSCGRSETLVPRRHVVRIERDYSNGMVVQFLDTFPKQLQGRISPDQFRKSIGILNNLFELADGSSFAHFVDNFLAVVTIYTSQLFITSHYEKRMKLIRQFISSENDRLYNPAGLALKDPGHNGFLNIEIDIYC